MVSRIANFMLGLDIAVSNPGLLSVCGNFRGSYISRIGKPKGFSS